MKVFLDVETCAFTGPAVLIQYAFEQGDVKLHEIWDVPAKYTLKLIETFCQLEVVAWNLPFDWFHLQRIYALLSYLDPDDIPKDHVEFLQKKDPFCWQQDKAIKPVAALDLLLYAKTGPLQMVMDRKDIVVRKVPAILADMVTEELNKRTDLPDLLFAKKADPTVRWTFGTHEKDPQFCDIALRFQPSAKLKDVVKYLDLDDTAKMFDEVSLSKKLDPEEDSWRPLQTKWSFYLQFHCDHWYTNRKARQYARKDVEYLQQIYEYFGSPDAGDDDSELAVQVAVTRFFGFAVDKDKLRERLPSFIEKENAAPTAPSATKKYLYPLLSEVELLALDGSTKSNILEEMLNWQVECELCRGEGCDKCDEGLRPHPVCNRVEEVLEARRAMKRRELCEKLIRSVRFHASFNVIGALSSRMSGTDGINPQGIPKKSYEREPFTLADGDMILSGGDFDAFEVTIACAAYDDETLEEELKSGKKIHVLFAEMMFPDSSYEDILESKGTDNDMYGKGKAGVFGDMYGGDWNTLVNRLGMEEEHAKQTTENWRNKYKGAARYRDEMHDRFASMKQPGGIGTRIQWHEPDEYVETLNGFKRYFTYENKICKMLFELANDPPKSWTICNQVVVRRDRQQTASGAARSAVFAAAFNVQAKNLRAAINHVIQGTGAKITKQVQRRIWDLQPPGVHPLQVKLMNVHDELLCVHRKELTSRIREIVLDTVDEDRTIVPLLDITWETDLKCWGYEQKLTDSKESVPMS